MGSSQAWKYTDKMELVEFIRKKAQGLHVLIARTGWCWGVLLMFSLIWEVSARIISPDELEEIEDFEKNARETYIRNELSTSIRRKAISAILSADPETRQLLQVDRYSANYTDFFAEEGTHKTLKDIRQPLLDKLHEKQDDQIRKQVVAICLAAESECRRLLNIDNYRSDYNAFFSKGLHKSLDDIKMQVLLELEQQKSEMTSIRQKELKKQNVIPIGQRITVETVFGTKQGLLKAVNDDTLFLSRSTGTIRIYKKDLTKKEVKRFFPEANSKQQQEQLQKIVRNEITPEIEKREAGLFRTYCLNNGYLPLNQRNEIDFHEAAPRWVHRSEIVDELRKYAKDDEEGKKAYDQALRKQCLSNGYLPINRDYEVDFSGQPYTWIHRSEIMDRLVAFHCRDEEIAKYIRNFLKRKSNLGNEKELVDSFVESGRHYLETSPEIGFRFFLMGAKYGSPEAMYELARCYANGTGTNKDGEKAFSNFKKAADSGYAKALSSLARCYYDGLGTPKNYSKSFEYLYQAETQGDISIITDLAFYYYRGIGVKKNFDEAFRLWEQAASIGDNRAIYMLGECYNNGCGVESNHTTAFKYFLKAAQENNADAQFMVGAGYEFGHGVNWDLEEALKWYTQAAKNGNGEASRACSSVREKLSVNVDNVSIDGVNTPAGKEKLKLALFNTIRTLKKQSSANTFSFGEEGGSAEFRIEYCQAGILGICSVGSYGYNLIRTIDRFYDRYKAAVSHSKMLSSRNAYEIAYGQFSNASQNISQMGRDYDEQLFCMDVHHELFKELLGVSLLRNDAPDCVVLQRNVVQESVNIHPGSYVAYYIDQNNVDLCYMFFSLQSGYFIRFNSRECKRCKF